MMEEHPVVNLAGENFNHFFVFTDQHQRPPLPMMVLPPVAA